MTKPATARCHWCKETPVKAVTRLVGPPPADPKLVGTEKDPRQVQVVRACANHKHLIEWRG